ncbi:MAG TPA: HNH endonuclease [Urbifossiella sp.]|nr:HNH endonuclease [Urbifossiella sp.]
MTVGGVTHSVHRLVLFAWVGPPGVGEECRHLDGNRSNNTVGNLAWGTPKENAADRTAMGRSCRPPVKWPVKLSFGLAKSIREQFAAGAAKKALARQFEVSPANIRKVLRGEAWRPHALAS